MIEARSLQIECRDAFLDLLEREIVGPHQIDEVLADQPHIKYIAGHLAPMPRAEAEATTEQADGIDLRQEDEIDAASGDDDTGAALEDSSISRARNESLSSIGLSFVVAVGARLEITAAWGEYNRVDGKYHRTQRQEEAYVELLGPVDLTATKIGRAQIQWVARRTSSGHLICSCFLVNATEGTLRDGSERLYQAGLEVRGADGTKPFLSRDLVIKTAGGYAQDNLLYRDRKEFGAGLHVAVEQSEIDEVAGVCGRLATRVVPRVETYVTKAGKFQHEEVLSMPYLASAAKSDLCETLRRAFADYAAWADGIQIAISALPKDMQPIAGRQYAAIEERIARIDTGISLIATDEAVFKAFRFANECMARTRFRQQIPRPDLNVPWNDALSGKWYPFQLAFLLSVIPDVLDPAAEHRQVVDILFFPTGGGKTEAYLGIAAFTMAWRRISADRYEGAGVSILMRYTLRLLTTQQFSRAASLIAAAELMRRSNWDNRILGTVPFGIGLWVGPMTPSRFNEAQVALFQAQIEHNSCPRNCELSRRDKLSPPKRRASGSTNVTILTECPWCFLPLCVENVIADKTKREIRIECGNSACPFSSSKESQLPVWFVDEDVYSHCPTLLIATVDKFATLAYKGAAKAIFGKWQAYCDRCGAITDMSAHSGKCGGTRTTSGSAPPFDLIIQDELHTISDNIGSVYGLYETAVEFLCGPGSRPKYIAATATIKEVSRQVEQLYGGRPSAVFPPTGLKAGDTYFSEDIRPSDDLFGRTYIGVYAPSKSRLTTFVSTLSAALASGAEIRKRFGVDAADPYLTILGYFNTIRDLGSVKALLADDVPPLVDKLCKENDWPPRRIDRWEDELTGRIDAAEVPQRLAELQTEFTADRPGIDFMACTNMISVGVDVPRLGLMVVDGQTKTTSEYIQTTSRVGRRKPGVVIVVYNAMRPRDVSHYEHFHAYHLSYYRFVEAGSVTPFSSGCIDRYIAGAFVSGYRLSDAQSDNSDANRFKTDRSGMLDPLQDTFMNRATRFGNDEMQITQDALDEIVTKWATAQDTLQYVKLAPPPGVPVSKATLQKMSAARSVIRAPEDKVEDPNAALFVAPTSMRNVESAVPLKVNTYGK